MKTPYDYQKEYRATPENRKKYNDYMKAYQQRPERKARQREYYERRSFIPYLQRGRIKTLNDLGGKCEWCAKTEQLYVETRKPRKQPLVKDDGNGFLRQIANMTLDAVKAQFLVLCQKCNLAKLNASPAEDLI